MKILPFLTEEPAEEPNLSPLIDFFFVMLMVVLLKASFFLVRVDPSLARSAHSSNPGAESLVGVQVLDSQSWQVGSRIVPSDQAREAIEEAMRGIGQDAVVALSFCRTTSAEVSWTTRARMQHEWAIPFVEIQPLDLPKPDHHPTHP
jgi:biopolymer transport protein ExbD